MLTLENELKSVKRKYHLLNISMLSTGIIASGSILMRNMLYGDNMSVSNFSNLLSAGAVIGGITFGVLLYYTITTKMKLKKIKSDFNFSKTEQALIKKEQQYQSDLKSVQAEVASNNEKLKQINKSELNSVKNRKQNDLVNSRLQLELKSDELNNTADKYLQDVKQSVPESNSDEHLQEVSDNGDDVDVSDSLCHIAIPLSGAPTVRHI